MNLIKKKLFSSKLFFVFIPFIFLMFSWDRRSFILLLISIFFVILVTSIFCKPIRNFSLVLSSFLLGIILLEGIALFKFTSNIAYTEYDPKSSYIKKGYFTKTFLGHQTTEGVYESKKLSSSGEIIYDVKYTIGPDGFRKSQNYDYTLINVYGGSFVFGEGVQDNETMSYFFSEEFKSNAKNYGVHGFGMHQALTIMKSEILNTRKIDIAVTAPWHALRSSCKPTFSANSPKYILKNGKLLREGFCDGGILYKIASKSYLIEFVLKKWKNQITDEDIKLYLEILKEMFVTAKKDGTFFVVGYIKSPENYLKSTTFTNKKIFQHISSFSDLAVDITLSDKRENLDKKYYIHELDQHPSKIANADRAKLISDQIKKNKLY